MNQSEFQPPYPLNTPVLFLVFNRFKSTEKVFNQIKKAKPPKLYLASDGARDSKSGEKEKVDTIRKYILDNIDWACEVNTLFRDKNMGCKIAVSNAIDWFFSKEEWGIILEDDCLPSQSFFWYCEELLYKYADDKRIFLISGYNKQGTWDKYNQDYFFARYGGIWGWATWRRAWKYYDLNMTDLDDFISENNFVKLLGKKLGERNQKTMLNARKENIDTWDFQWGYTRTKNSGLACVPSKNLIENIGFGLEATHTKCVNLDKTRTYELNFPLKENNFFIPDRDYDYMYVITPKYKKIKQKVANFLYKFKNKMYSFQKKK